MKNVVLLTQFYALWPLNFHVNGHTCTYLFFKKYKEYCFWFYLYVDKVELTFTENFYILLMVHDSFARLFEDIYFICSIFFWNFLK